MIPSARGYFGLGDSDFAVEGEALKVGLERHAPGRLLRDPIVAYGDEVTNCGHIPKMARGTARAFTEQGVAMLSSVLRSPGAVEVNIAIMRTFVQPRRLMDSNRQLARKIEAMEKKYDEQFSVVFDAIKRLIAEDAARKSQPKRRIGFVS
jgi:hypothetical protein